MDMPHQVVYVLLAAIALLIYRHAMKRKALPFPPGPKGKLVSGNVHQLPRTEPYKAYKEWSARFGSPLVHYRLYTKHTLILNTYKAAYDLLESRSKSYSDRPMLWMYHHLVGRKLAVFNISSQHPRFPVYRKMLNSTLNSRAVSEYDGLIDRESRILLENLNKAPEGFAKHFRRNAGALILHVAYGWSVTEDDDHFVRLMEDTIILSQEIFRPGGWLVDIFPILRFLPSWAPGASFKRLAAFWCAEFRKLESIPFDWTKKQMVTGDYHRSFTSQQLAPEDGHGVSDEEEDIIKWCSAALYGGGADTTVSAMKSFALLMVLYPEVQRRAQAEIDEVVGRDRLPSLDDELSLPYVSAVIKEVLRYAPVVPLGLAHRSLIEDEYMGYRVPKGCTVYANIWAISRDPALYRNSNVFSPDRFLGEDAEMDSRKLVFGFGRRICPGIHFAEKSLFLNISRMLASFSFLRPLGADGREADIAVAWTGALTSYPAPFECRIIPRKS